MRCLMSWRTPLATFVVMGFAVAMFAAGLYHLNLVASGFALSTVPGETRYEVADKDQTSRLFSTSYKVLRKMTWGDVAELFSLSSPLLRESYNCTFKFGRPAASSESAIRSERIQSQQSVQIVLKPGACPSSDARAMTAPSAPE
jgi:hypothetical protein